MCAAFVCAWPLSGVTSYLRIAWKPCKGWESVWDVGLKWPCGITETNSQLAVVCVPNLDEGRSQSIAEAAAAPHTELEAGPVCPEQVGCRACSVCSRVCFKA